MSHLEKVEADLKSSRVWVVFGCRGFGSDLYCHVWIMDVEGPI